MGEFREHLNLEVAPLSPNRFEILAITAGAANGWEFPADVLRESLALWEGVNCFVDHSLSTRSVRDIAGVLCETRWDERVSGVRAELTAFGPSGKVLSEIGRQVLEVGDEPSVRVGFSADVLFRGKAGKVEKILKIYSVDLVYNPARGGIFVRALNQFGIEPFISGGMNMQSNGNNNQTGLAKGTAKAQSEEDVADIQLQLSQMREMRSEIGAFFLEGALLNTRLPLNVQQRIRAQFEGRSFEPSEVSLALREAHMLLGEFEGAKSVLGPARIEGMIEPSERLQAAADDLFGAPRDKKMASAAVPRLSGIRELYLNLTGDYDLHGGYFPERAQLAKTTDFSGLVKNSLNKVVANTWEELGKAGYDWWKDVTVQEHFSTLHEITGTLIGTVGDLPSIAEGGAYPELQVGDSPETANFVKYGGYLPLTLELIDRDETRKLRSYARELASAGMRKISRLVAEIFTKNSGAGPYLADGSLLFNNTAVTTAGGHANLDTLALTHTNWDQVGSRVYNQPMLIKEAAAFYGTGPRMAVNPKFILVGRSLQKAAMEICAGSLVREPDYAYDNVLKGSAVPVVVPEWTDLNDWAAACDPRVAPAIFVGERFGLMPEIFIAGDEHSPAVFSNDEHRLKVRHYLAVWVNDFRPLFKCNVV